MPVDQTWRDVRHAVRTLRSGRLFTTVVLVCLALGIATNTTMFSVFDAMFLRPLPFRDPGRLVSIAGRHPETARSVALSLDDLRDLAPTLRSFERVAAYSGRTATLTDGGEPERISAQLVTANLFPLLGEQPQRGRSFEAADDQVASAGVVLVSDALWRRRYQADPGVIGRAIRLDNAPYTVIGVMPPKFKFPSSSELWIAMTPALGAAGAASRRVSWLGRLTPETTLERANAELASKALPARGPRSVRVGFGRLLSANAVGSEERTITGALMGATTVLLLIACANVANLLLARGAGRRREIAVRAALGATRGRIARQLLTESVVLALLAGVLALPLAWYGIHWIHDAVPASDPLGPYYIDWSLDVRTFLYAITIALLTGLVFGVAPAFDAAGRHLLSPLREGAGASSSRLQRRVHGALIVAQMALALLLLAGASIFVRTYAGLRAVELGFDTSHLMTMRVYLAGAAYDAEPARIRAVDEIAERLRTLPGAHASTVTDLVPLDDQGGADGPAAVEGRVFPDGKAPIVHYAGVAGQWPETFDVQLLAGRAFRDDELHDRRPVALVNRTLAKTFWPGQDPIGRRFRFADDPANPWLTVIGLVPDIRTVKLDETGVTPPTAYVPHRFVSTRNWGIVTRARANPESVTAAIAAAVHAVDPSLAVFDVWSMEQVRWLSYWMYVLWGTLFGVFGVIALFVAAVGVYGVIFYTVARRTKEIGLRVALGAGRMQVVGPMLRQVAGLSAVGIAIGLGGALAVTPVVGSLLIGVSPTDPISFAVVSILLALVALVATWIPAWRASAVSPLEALRSE
jgi:predicted permease